MIQFDIMYVLMAVVYSASIFGNYVATFYEPQQKRLIICSASQAGFVFSSMLLGLLKRRMKREKVAVAGNDEVDVELGTFDASIVGGPNFEASVGYVPPYHVAGNDSAEPPPFELSITAPPSPYTNQFAPQMSVPKRKGTVY